MSELQGVLVHAAAPASGNPDPLTGGISYREPSSTPAAPSVAATSSGLVYTPHREYQLFEAAPAVDKVAAKLRELSAAVPADAQLSEQDAAPGGGLDQLLDVRPAFAPACVHSLRCCMPYAAAS